jgi:hypothetical protein
MCRWVEVEDLSCGRHALGVEVNYVGTIMA